MERMITNLSIIRAMRGKSSQIWMPGTLVEIGRNSPRISEGELGFRSKESMWEGPPGRKMLMIDLWELPVPALASTERSWESDSPPAARPPTFRKARRDMGAQSES